MRRSCGSEKIRSICSSTCPASERGRSATKSRASGTSSRWPTLLAVPSPPRSACSRVQRSSASARAGAAAASASAVSFGATIGPASSSATGPSSAWDSWRSGFFSSSCWMNAASSRCENCSNLIACCSCGVIANVWREARMRLGPIRMCPYPWRHYTSRKSVKQDLCQSSEVVRSVLEDVDLRPAGQVQPGAAGQEAESGLGQLGAALAFQQGIQLGLERMEVQHIGGGVVELFLAQRLGAPVGGLLLLGQVDAQKLPAEILEAPAIGEGAGELGGDLGAIDRLAAHAQRMLERGDVETPEMKE